MTHRIWAAVAVVCAACAVSAGAAQAEYVRDGIRINLRSQAGTEYRIVRTLSSGDQVTVLARESDWIQVRMRSGERESGWVPRGYLSVEVPASVSLPAVSAQLKGARAQIGELEASLQAQQNDLTELASLRTQASELETRNIELASASTWRNMGAGALIALSSLGIGAFWGRRNRAASGRRIKL